MKDIRHIVERPTGIIRLTIPSTSLEPSIRPYYIRKLSPEQQIENQLEKIDIKVIEKFLRKKKLERINK